MTNKQTVKQTNKKTSSWAKNKQKKSVLTWGSSKSSLDGLTGIAISHLSFKAVWLASASPGVPIFPVSRLIRAVARRRLVAMLFFVTSRGRLLSLRTRRGLLCFDWAAGNHVVNALTEMALLRLRRQLALFGVVVQAAAVVASAWGGAKSRESAHKR